MSTISIDDSLKKPLVSSPNDQSDIPSSTSSSIELDQDKRSIITIVDDDNESKSVIDKLKRIYNLISQGNNHVGVVEICEILFKIEKRGTTIKLEMYYGLIHFISCLYIIPVVSSVLIPTDCSDVSDDNPSSCTPDLISNSKKNVISITILMIGFGSIILGFIANLPYIMAPATVIIIFLSEFTSANVDGTLSDQLSLISTATIISGCLLILIGFKPFGVFITKLIPRPINVGTAVGIGLLTTFKGTTEAGIIEFTCDGTSTHLSLGNLQNNTIYIVGFGYFLISILLHYKLKSAFCIALFLCTCLGWIVSPSTAPKQFGSTPQLHSNVINSDSWTNPHDSLSLFTADLAFLTIIYLNGVLTPLIKLANLESATSLSKNPRGKWVFVISGIMSIFSGLGSGVPIVISAESLAGIKAGAKTGLSSIVGGLIFLCTIFLIPIFQAVPTAGTSPVLLMVGTVLFQNVGGINWKNVTDSSTAFVVLFFIPFTSSVIQGVLIGYINYVVVGTATLHNHEKLYSLLNYYLPELAQKIKPSESSPRTNDDDSVVPEIQSVVDDVENVQITPTAANPPFDRK